MILAGDVGGTKVRLALFDERGGITCVDEEKFASQEFPNLSELLKKFLSSRPDKNITEACFGIAGPIREGVCKATNLPWEISRRSQRGRIPWERMARILRLALPRVRIYHPYPSLPRIVTT